MMAPPPVAVLACYVTPQATTWQASGIEINYVNRGATTLHSVTFRLKYHTIDRDVYADVTDAGSFAPGKTIEHHFDAFEGESFLPGSPASCEVREAD